MSRKFLKKWSILKGYLNLGGPGGNPEIDRKKIYLDEPRNLVSVSMICARKLRRKRWMDIRELRLSFHFILVGCILF